MCGRTVLGEVCSVGVSRHGYISSFGIPRSGWFGKPRHSWFDILRNSWFGAAAIAGSAYQAIVILA